METMDPTATAIRHWLIVYFRPTGDLIRCQEYSDGQEALDERFKVERAFSKTQFAKDTEAVVLGADSLDTLRRTHSRYFAREGQQSA